MRRVRDSFREFENLTFETRRFKVTWELHWDGNDPIAQLEGSQFSERTNPTAKPDTEIDPPEPA